MPKIKFTMRDSSFFNWLQANCAVEFPDRAYLAEFHDYDPAAPGEREQFRDMRRDRMRQIFDLLHNKSLMAPRGDEVRTSEVARAIGRQVDGLLAFAARSDDAKVKP